MNTSIFQTWCTPVSLETCADLVKIRDPDRYRAAMAAPAETQSALFALYAFNTEVFHAVWATNEPGLAEIRLQYWHDQIDALYRGTPTDPHPVLDALRGEDRLKWVAKEDFHRLITARRWDAYTAPFEDETALRAYLMATGGTVMAMASRILGMRDDYDPAIRNFGYAAGLAAFLQAVPKLKAHGRQPLPDESDAALRNLAADAVAKMDATKKHRLMAVANPAMLAASEARPVLKMVIATPSKVRTGDLNRAPIQQKWRAMWLQILDRW